MRCLVCTVTDSPDLDFPDLEGEDGEEICRLLRSPVFPESSYNVVSSTVLKMNSQPYFLVTKNILRDVFSTLSSQGKGYAFYLDPRLYTPRIKVSVYGSLACQGSLIFSMVTSAKAREPLVKRTTVFSSEKSLSASRAPGHNYSKLIELNRNTVVIADIKMVDNRLPEGEISLSLLQSSIPEKEEVRVVIEGCFVPRMASIYEVV